MIGRRNKPTEARSKRVIYDLHLGPFFGAVPITQIGDAAIGELRARLVETITRDGRPLSDKRINNILAVLSKALHYAQQCKLIRRHAPHRPAPRRTRSRRGTLPSTRGSRRL